MPSSLHLPSLSIESFRALRFLELPQLGRVTLLAGANGIGKTTVLEAIRFYASMGNTRVLLDLIDSREEFISETDEEGDTLLFPDFTSLFNDYDPEDFKLPPTIRISSAPRTHDLSLQLINADNEDDPTNVPHISSSESQPRDLRISIGEHNHVLLSAPMIYAGIRHHNADRYRPMGYVRPIRTPDSWPSPIKLESLGPGLLHNTDVARLWDAVTLTEAEDFAIQALRLVVGDTLDRLAVVGDTPRSSRTRGRRVVAKLSSSSRPVPLKRLGDGANRLLAIAIAIANCRDGILLVDEVENGIHYSIQPALWRMVFTVAEQTNVQVVAATHSWDCIAGFASAALDTPSLGVLFRIEHFQDEHHAVHFPEEDLAIAARQRIEVR